MGLSVNFSLNNERIFEKQTAKEFFFIYLAYSVKMAVQLQFIDAEEAPYPANQISKLNERRAMTSPQMLYVTSLLGLGLN